MWMSTFPYLHITGKFGKDFKRKVKLTEQYYFVARMWHTSGVFIKNPAYLFSATAFIEWKQLTQNLNLPCS